MSIKVIIITIIAFLPRFQITDIYDIKIVVIIIVIIIIRVDYELIKDFPSLIKSLLFSPEFIEILN